MVPSFTAGVLAFASFFIHVLVIGTSAFPGGHVDGHRHWVEDHGRVIELSATQYWSSYLLGVLVVASYAVLFLLAAVFHWRGEVRWEDRRG